MKKYRYLLGALFCLGMTVICANSSYEYGAEFAIIFGFLTIFGVSFYISDLNNLKK